ncbi:hypothetical protein NN561_014067 [Cricetulus griseus]
MAVDLLSLPKELWERLFSLILFFLTVIWMQYDHNDSVTEMVKVPSNTLESRGGLQLMLGKPGNSSLMPGTDIVKIEPTPAYGLIVDRKMPTIAQFFEREADTKRRLADKFVQLLGKLKYRICRPIPEDLKMSKTDTPIEAILMAQELEGIVREMLDLLIEISVADHHADRPEIDYQSHMDTLLGVLNLEKELTKTLQILYDRASTFIDTQAYGFTVNRKMPTFAQFFEREAEAKRRIADQFLELLGKRKCRICRPDSRDFRMTAIDTRIKAIMVAQELEEGVRQNLELLMDISIATNETDAYGLIVDRKMPTFAWFFEREAETRRSIADQFLQLLGKHKYRICRPIPEKCNLSNIDTPIKALMMAQELEEGVRDILEILIHASVADQQTDLSRLFEPLLEEQKKNEDFLKFQLDYYEREESRIQEPFDSATPSTSSGAGI